MTKTQTFLIKTDTNKEAVMRLPVDKYGGITMKAREAIRKRFYDGSNGHDISEAIAKYYKNKI